MASPVGRDDCEDKLAAFEAERSLTLKAEDRLKESEARLKDAQRLARLGSFHYDAAADKSFWSDELFILYGISPDRDALSIAEARSFLHPEDRGIGAEMALRAKEAGGIAEGEYRIIRPDGAIRYHHAISRYTFDSSGRLLAVDGTVQDVTERKNAENALSQYKDQLELLISERNQELERSDARLEDERDFSEALIDVLPGIFFAYDCDDRLVRRNSNLRDFEMADGREGSFERFLSPEYASRLSLAKQQARDTGAAAVELRFESGGKTLWYLTTLISVRAGGRDLLVGTGIDISVRKKAERELALLQSITRQISETPDYSRALQSVLGLICQATSCEYGESWLPDTSEAVLSPGPAWFGEDEGLSRFASRTRTYKFASGEGFVGRIWETARPQWLENADSNDRTKFLRTEEFADSGLKAMWGLPVMIGSKRLAVLCFGMRREFRDDYGLIDLTSVVVHAIGALMLRKKSDDELRKLSQAIRQSPVSVLVTDKRGIIKFINPKFCEVTGYSAEEVLGKNPRILNSGKLSREFYDDLWGTILSGSTWKGEFINRKKDGTEYIEQASIAPILDADGLITNFVAVKEDVTGQKRTMELLSISERRMDLAFSGSGFGWWDWDVASGRLVSSPLRWRALGYGDGAVAESIAWWRSLLHPDDIPLSDKLIRQVLDGEIESFDVRVRMRNAQGEWVWFRDRGKIVERDSQSRAKTLIGTSQDITDIVRAEEEMSSARLLAEDASRAKSGFLATVSHEIRTPMNAIIGLSHLALDTKLDRQQRGYLERILESGVNLLGIINDILDFSKIESGKLSMERIDFSLAEVFSHIDAALGEKIRSKKLEYFCDIDPAVPRVLIGDPLRLQQVLLNLIGNAVKFTHDGFIAVSVKPISSGSSEVVLDFSVADTGIGMTAAERGRLFKPFMQADASTTRMYGGTGLGLAISANLVEKMGGGIHVESEKGKGSRFSFTASFGVSGRLLSELRIRPERGSLSRGGASGARLLVVEDNELNRDVARELLNKAGFRVEVVEGGASALTLASSEAAAGRAFDLILMDLRMPGMDGYEAARSIHAIPVLSKVPIIAMSADAMSGVKEQVYAAGMVDFISKPIIPSVMVEVLDRWLGSGPPKRAEPAASGSLSPASSYTHLDAEKGLAMVGGDVAFYASVLRKFLEDHERTPSAIDGAIAAGDRKTALLAAHTLKGAAATVGGASLSREAAILEDALKRDTPYAGVDSVRVGLAALSSDIRAYLESLEPENAAADDPGNTAEELLDGLGYALTRDIPTAMVILEKIQIKLAGGVCDTELRALVDSVSNFDISAARQAAEVLSAAVRAKKGSDQ